MKKLWKDNQGVVTVIVTLLLIPALLITGTGVDLARIFTAKSIVQDANQMAANSVMTQYDAMLQDVYGLFAVASKDEELEKMVTDYVNLSIYGSTTPTATGQMGTLQLFSGSVTSSSITKKQNLGQLAVLRHQIEDYAKFRAPVVIAQEVMERLEAFDRIKTDSDLIQDKVAIDDMVSDLQTLFNELKEAIDKANKIQNEERLYLDRINNLLKEIKSQFGKMVTIREEYVSAFDDTEDIYYDEKLEACEDKYEICVNNIRSLISGSARINTWTGGMEDEEEGEWIPVEKKFRKSFPECIEDELSRANGLKRDWNGLLDKVVSKCRQFDSKTSSIKTEVQNLKTKLNSADCTPELKEGLREQIALYEKMLVDEDGDPLNATKLGEEFRGSESSGNMKQIASFIEDIKNIRQYGSVSNNAVAGICVSFDRLSNITSIKECDIDAEIQNRTLSSDHTIDLSWLSKMANISNYRYINRYEITVFKHISTKHENFYANLAEMCDSGGGGTSDAKSNILNYLKLVQQKIKGIADYIPQGAGYYGSKSSENGNSEFGQGDTWNDADSVKDQTFGAMDEVTGLVDALDNVVDKVLLVSYASEMFSSFVSPQTDEGEKAEISMSGVPIDTHINYFYQSELEYLYNGNAKSATANLAAVSGTILLIRFVFNYISTFNVDAVKTTLEAIRKGFSAAGPIGSAVGIVIAELARIAFALGESAFDIADLRNGKAVPVLKNDQTWQTSIANIATQAATLAVKDSTGMSDKETETGLYYIDYLRILLLVKDGNEITRRMKTLIELNVTNIKNGVYEKGSKIYGKESEMSGKTLFDLDTSGTAFEISTTVNLQFLFFPMGYFQKGVEGTKPPNSIDVTAAAYRGY